MHASATGAKLAPHHEDAPSPALTDVRGGPDAGTRHDLYAVVHKGLRSFMGEVLATVGRLDAEDAAQTAETLGQAQALLEVCRAHLHKENRYIHPAMESRRPGSTRHTEAEHAHHEEAIETLEAEIRTAEAAPPALRVEAIRSLYLTLSLFVAENLQHMCVEETHNNPVLWETHGDEELKAIEQALVAEIPPAQKAMFLRWMAPASTPRERTRLLAGIRESAPAPVVSALMEMLRPHLGERDWSRLQSSLG